jgi:hypothetical protein
MRNEKFQWRKVKSKYKALTGIVSGPHNNHPFFANSLREYGF